MAFGVSLGLGGSDSEGSTDSRTRRSGESTTELSGRNVTQRFDQQAKAMLDAFTARQLRVTESEDQFTREQAIADVQGTVDNIFRQFSEQALPEIYSAQNQAGAYNTTAGQQLANDAYGEAVAQSANVISENIARYAQLGQQNQQMQLSALMDAFQLQGQAFEATDLDQTSTSEFSGTSSTSQDTSGSSTSWGIGGSGQIPFG